MYGIIYRAYLLDGRSYVGQTIKPLNKRINEHKCASQNKKDQRYFYKALRKYGFNAFSWEVVAKAKTEQELNLLEEQFIEKYDSINNGYNLREAGFRKRHHPETCKKIAESKLGSRNPMFGKPSWNKDKKLSKEHIENLSKSHKDQIPWNKGLEKEKQPNFNKKHSQNSKNKISKANSGENNGQTILNWEKVRAIRSNYKTGNFTQKQIANLYKISQTNVCNIVNNKLWKES